MKEKRIVVALGRNAFGETFPEQKKNVKKAAQAIADLVEQKYQIVITHSNGPQVGMIQTAMTEFARLDNDKNYTVAPMSLCGAMSEGYIGYDLQNAIRTELLDRGIFKPVSTIITQVRVDPFDKAFNHPTKVIGRVMTREEADAEEEKGNHVVPEGDGFRRIIASPKPVDIYEIDAIEALLDAGQIVIAAGGGGIPVMEQGTTLKGASAVIEKDYTAAKLADMVDASHLMILTAREYMTTKDTDEKLEKPFHEIILQVGGKGNMNADTENGELAKQILDEYYQGFQERNPQLRVFSAHLHMDEATPHLHIDFVPFTTGSKRGLDTRVSLKQALATQGFKGGSRGDTEWSQWIQSEKEQLAAVMERYGIEWEHLGTHEKHLSVLDYKKQEREKEVAALGAKIEQKQIEFDVLSERVLNYDKAKDELSNLEIELDTAPKYQLPEPEKFMTAKAYKTKMAEPVVRKLKQLVKTVLARCFEGWDNYHRLNTANAQLYRTNQRLEKVNERLTEENKILKAENKDYSLLRKVFGRKQIDDLLEQARTVKGRKRDNTRSR